jgi:hypothetical protein
MKRDSFKNWKFTFFLALALGVILIGLMQAPVSATGGAPAGSGFLLGGTAQNAQDPENPSNDVMKMDN